MSGAVRGGLNNLLGRGERLEAELLREAAEGSLPGQSYEQTKWFWSLTFSLVHKREPLISVANFSLNFCFFREMYGKIA